MRNSQKYTVKKISLLIALVCFLLVGCGEERIKAPFESSACVGKNVEEISKQLQDAGFTNIKTEAQDTTVEYMEEQVVSVKIGSNTIWNEANTWKPDEEVLIKFYNYTGIHHMTVSMGIEISGEEGMPVFTVATNLPDGTVLSAELAYIGELTDLNDDYVETQELTVENGTAQTEAYTKDGEPLAGNYGFSILMLPAEQSEEVQQIIGTSGEALKGDDVEAMGDYNYILTSLTYESPIAVQKEESEMALVDDAELEARFAEALSGFGDNYNINLQGYVYTVQVWQDGLAATAALAKNGDRNAQEQWNRIVDTTLKGSESLQELLELSGYENYAVQLQILNDENLENTLLTTYFGLVSYNCVED